MSPEHRNSMVALMDCLTDLQNFGNHPDLVDPIKLAIRRCANIMTSDNQEKSLKARMKRFYDNDGKIPAIREYRATTNCDLITAKKKIEEWFPYISPACKVGDNF